MVLEQLWKAHGQRSGLKVRWLDWNHQHRYFVIDKLDEQTGRFIGHLDCGEPISYHKTSHFWKVYADGDEHTARAS